MKRLALSRGAAGLVRALISRGQDGDDRILLREIRSEDWQSLLFTGERHVISLRIIGPQARRVALSLSAGLAEAEFNLSGTIVADISAYQPISDEDGSISVEIEALTIDE